MQHSEGSTILASGRLLSSRRLTSVGYLLRLSLRFRLHWIPLVWFGAILPLSAAVVLQQRVINPLILVFFCSEIPVAVHFMSNMIVLLDLPKWGWLSLSARARGTVGWVVGTHLIVASLIIIFDMNFLSAHSAWCCKRDRDVEVLCQHANDVGNFLEARGIEHWLCGGSLFAAAQDNHRDGPWANDVDICVLANLTDVSQHLSQSNFDVEHGVACPVHKASRSHKRIPAANQTAACPTRVLLTSKWWYYFAELWIDMYEYKRFDLSDADFTAIIARKDTLVIDSGQWRQPSTLKDFETLRRVRPDLMPLLKHQAFPLRRLEFCGRMWLAPQNYEAVLMMRFGKVVDPNWQAPVIEKLDGVRGWACRTWLDG